MKVSRCLVVDAAAAAAAAAAVAVAVAAVNYGMQGSNVGNVERKSLSNHAPLGGIGENNLVERVKSWTKSVHGKPHD